MTAASDGMEVAAWTTRDGMTVRLSAQEKQDEASTGAPPAHDAGVSGAPHSAHGDVLSVGVVRAMHARSGAVLVDQDGCLVDANTVALEMLGLQATDIGARIGIRLAQIAVRTTFGPHNGVVPRMPDADGRLGAYCLPMGAMGAATTLYLLWEKQALPKPSSPHTP